MKNNKKGYRLKEKEKTSHYLSMVLRHRPDPDLKMDKQGWVLVDNMINKINEIKEFEEIFTFEDLKEIVNNDNKQRFALKTKWDKTYIRANQGHSKGLGLEMDYKPVVPPNVLYHGTAEKYVESILKDGLISKTRLFVHLSSSESVATTVGERHGKPVIFVVDARKMHQDGILFYMADNGVWLTESVPVKYITILEN